MFIDPLMSLVDTAVRGQASSLQLASLAPCTSIYQFVFTMFYFLSITTTTLVAANPPVSTTTCLDAADEVSRRIDFNETVVSRATLLALIFGILSTMTLFLFSQPLMMIAGCSSPEIMSLGTSYLKIRALGRPFVLVATVLQGASIGRQDAWTP
jgi:Na+-driven multidrug efflux pump